MYWNQVIVQVKCNGFIGDIGLHCEVKIKNNNISFNFCLYNFLTAFFLSAIWATDTTSQLIMQVPTLFKWFLFIWDRRSKPLYLTVNTTLFMIIFWANRLFQNMKKPVETPPRPQIFSCSDKTSEWCKNNNGILCRSIRNFKKELYYGTEYHVYTLAVSGLPYWWLNR